MNVVSNGNTTFVAAAFRGWLGDTVQDLLIYEVGGNRLPPPPGGRLYFAPVAAVDRQGTFHMIWAEPDSAADRDILERNSIRMALRRLMYAAYHDGHWSHARQIYAAGRGQFFVYLRDRSALVIDGAGTLHYVFTGADGELIHLSHDARGWRIAVIPDYHGPGIVPGGSGGLYPTLVAGPGRRLSLAFVDPPEGPGERRGLDPRQANVNSVFFRRSDDGGKSWNRPVLVHLSGGSPAMKLQLVRSGGDTLHLFWVTTPRGGTPVGTGVAHVLSADGGRTWSKVDIMPVPAGIPAIQTIAAATALDGTIHVVFSPLGLPNPHLWHSRIEAGKLVAAEPLLPDPSRPVESFAVSFDPLGREHLIWTNAAPYRENGPPGYTDLRLSYAVRPPCNKVGASAGRGPAGPR